MKFGLILACVGLFTFGSTSAIGKTPDSKITHRKPIGPSEVYRPKPGFPALDPSPIPQGFKMMVPEWADSDSVMLSWAEPHFVSAFTNKTKVTSFADSDADVRWWKKWLKSKSIPNPKNFQVLKIPTDSIFPRDYGPEFIYRNRNLEMVDFQYYAARQDDDLLPDALAQHLKMNIHKIGLHSEGGNILGDGLNRGYASTWLRDENKAITLESLVQRLYDFLGWRSSVIHPFVEDEGFWAHIDTFAKLVAIDTWIVADFPEGSMYRAGVEKFVTELRGLRPQSGGQYKIFRLPMVQKPGTQDGESYRGYLNSLIHNQFVFVASYGDERDEEAFRVYRETMPGYEVVPVYAPTTAWGDAVHCRTRNIPTRRSLYMAPWFYSSGALGDHMVSAVAYWPPEMELDGTPTITWKIGSGEWQTKELERMGENFYTEFPPQPAGTQIHYYFEGKLVGRPAVLFPRFAPLKTFEAVVE